MLHASTQDTLDRLAKAETVADLKIVLQNVMLMILMLETRLADQGSLRR